MAINPRYIQLTSNGYLHIIGEGGKTVCGRNYRQYDYLTHDVPDENAHALCHKCQNKRREGPRTIREAFQPNCYELRERASEGR